VNIDTELETWKREWRDQSEPVPDLTRLKRKIRRQNVRVFASAATIVACIVVSTVAAFWTRSSYIYGLATGLWMTALIVGGYDWWVRRGTWKPEAQTTLAYLNLSYKRAVAKARTIRFSFYFLLTFMVFFAAFSLWDRKSFHLRAGIVLVALVIELFFLSHFGRRKRLEMRETKKLLDQTKE
jgi:hypothetical protein